MNQAQLNRKHMLETTLSFLDNQANVWQSVSKIAEVKNSLSLLLNDINTLSDDQAQAANNYGKIKSELKHTIALKADIINDLVEVYALMNDMPALADKMADSRSDLFKLKNDVFIQQAQHIVASAEEHVETLIADYGMTREQITDLQNDIDRFLEINGLPRSYSIKSDMATKGLEDLFDHASEILGNRLDKLTPKRTILELKFVKSLDL